MQLIYRLHAAPEPKFKLIYFICNRFKCFIYIYMYTDLKKKKNEPCIQYVYMLENICIILQNYI